MVDSTEPGTAPRAFRRLVNRRCYVCGEPVRLATTDAPGPRHLPEQVSADPWTGYVLGAHGDCMTAALTAAVLGLN
jgi:hypothetical protein